jgi:hypothetical protein
MCIVIEEQNGGNNEWKSYAYAYAIGTSHIKEKINVLNVKYLAQSSCDLKNGIEFRDEQWR